MRDADQLMWETRPCPGCKTPVSVPRDIQTTRLCLACQAWQRVERERLKAGLPPAIENNLGQDEDRDRAARLLIDLLDAPSAPESPLVPKRKPEPEPTHEPDDYGYIG